MASYAAHEVGLAVWFSPWKMNVGFEATRDYVVEAAKLATQLQSEGVDVTLITACEYTVFNQGIYPGEQLWDRLTWIKERLQGWPNIPVNLPSPLPEKAVELNQVLRALRDAAREHFSGPQVYSSAIFEEVDWTLFDYAGPNYYRETQTDDEYGEGFKYFHSFARPIAIPEFGCCTYKGAAERGARGHDVITGYTDGGGPVFANGVRPVRSETEQADYAERQLRFFNQQGVEAAFVFQFYCQALPTGAPERDFDLGSFALVKYLPTDDPRSSEVPGWEKKEVFHRVSGIFHDFKARLTALGQQSS